jgi:glycosyltransferase involved in cell wall biosynthesis
MTILLANKFHFLKGGSERYYFDLARSLEAAGHRVVPFAMRHASNEPTPYARHFVSEVSFEGDGRPRERLRRAARVLYSVEARSRMARLVEEERPDVAHLHNIAHQLSPSILEALSVRGVPIVQTLHDYKLACPTYLFLAHGRPCERCIGGRFHHAARLRCNRDSFVASLVNTVEMYLHAMLGTYDRVDRFLCPSRFLLDKMREAGIEERRLVHMPYFVFASDYRPSPIKSGHAVYLGRLSREKGLVTLLRAVALAPNVRLVVLGDGGMRPELESLATALGIGSRVTFAGMKFGEEMHALVRDARFTVIPSEWYENLPYAALESFALGTAAVASRIGGLPELVRDGETGLTFAPGDASALAEAMEALWNDPAASAVMGRNARDLIEREYDAPAHLERILALYAGLGALPAGRPAGGRP